MKLTEAMETLSILKELSLPHLIPQHKEEIKQALDLGISALKTIEDGNYQLKTHLNAAYGKMCYKDTDSAGAVDLKTLYEQTTMYCEKDDERYQYFANGDVRKVEYYQQPDTPIRVVAVWNISKSTPKLIEISYQIKEN